MLQTTASWQQLTVQLVITKLMQLKMHMSQGYQFVVCLWMHLGVQTTLDIVKQELITGSLLTFSLMASTTSAQQCS